MGKILQSMTDKEAAILTALQLHGADMNKAAQSLQISEEAARQRLSRLLKRYNKAKILVFQYELFKEALVKIRAEKAFPTKTDI